MEGKNNQNDSSSFVSELFGSKKAHPSSSSGVFGSLVSSQSPNVMFFFFYIFMFLILCFCA